LGWCEVDDLADFAHAENTVRSWHEPIKKQENHLSIKPEVIRRNI